MGYLRDFKVNNYTLVSNILDMTYICLLLDSVYLLLLYIPNIHGLENSEDFRHFAKVIIRNLEQQGHIH